MKITANINGYETPIDFNSNELNPYPLVTGKSPYQIDYGNGLGEVGGTVLITLTNSKESYIDIDIPFETLLNAHCSVLDVQGYHGEGCHLELLSGSKIRIYAHTIDTFTGSIKVMYSMKGY